MSDGMGREFAYLSSHATNRYFIPNWGSICATPQTESHASIGKRIAKVGKYKATVGHFHATPQMVVLQVGSKMYLC